MHEDRLVNLRTLLPTYMYFHCNMCPWSRSPSNEEPSLDFQQVQECCIFATDDQTGSTSYTTWRKKVRALHSGEKCRNFSGLCSPKGRNAQVFSYSVFSFVSTCEWSLRLTRFRIIPSWKREYDFSISSNPTKITADRRKVTMKR